MAPPYTAPLLHWAVLVLMLASWTHAWPAGQGCDYMNTPRCQESMCYRSVDGSCNNLRNPWLGKSNTPLLRLVAPDYGDRFGKPRVSQRGGPLPSAQRIVTRLMPEEDRELYTTHLFAIWGQLISHDFSLIAAPKIQVSGPCCDRRPADQCIPIPVPRNDPFYSQFNVVCLPLTRTNTSSCDAKQPEQLSLVTHFLDASFVYGSDRQTSRRLRQGQGGLLRAREVGVDGLEFPPNVRDPNATCGFLPCYDSGDIRINQNPMLAGIQTLFLREHNRVARVLSYLNPHWDDERLFQEARRIVVAEWQLITYRDWLQWLLGEERVRALGLVPDGPTDKSLYRADVDPRTANDVTTASFRALHSMVQGTFWVGARGRRTEKLGRWFDNPGKILEGEFGFVDVLQGLVYQHSQDQDRYMDKELTQQMESVRTQDGRRWGSNLIAVDIQRGRDHGIPPYTAYREYVGLGEDFNFNDLLDTLTPEDVNALREVYDHVDDVDYYVGGILERRKKRGSLFGPTFQPLLEDQFWRWRFGDRYFFNFVGFKHSFSYEQLRALEAASVGRLLCDNVKEINRVPWDAFIKTGFQGNHEMECDDLFELDLSAWKENQHNKRDFCQ